MRYPKLKKHLNELTAAVEKAEVFAGWSDEPEFVTLSTKEELSWKQVKQGPIKYLYDPINYQQAFSTIEVGTHLNCSFTWSDDPIKRQFICVIPRNICNSKGIYLSLLTHEYVHATGHRDRLYRSNLYTKTKESHHEEECVAQLGSYLILKFLGYSDELVERMTAKYLKRHQFLDLIKNDSKRDILCRDVDAASKYILERLKLNE